MIKTTISASGASKTVIVNANKTIAEIFEDEEINYRSGLVTMNGFSVDADDFNTSLGELLGDETNCYLSVSVKANNAAKITVLGEAAVLTSTLKLEDLKKMEKYSPDDLTMYDEDGEPVFRLAIAEEGDAGSVNEYGVLFSERADADGNARVTMNVCPAHENQEQAILDHFGQALLKLNDMEEIMPGRMEKLNGKLDKIKSMITVA